MSNQEMFEAEQLDRAIDAMLAGRKTVLDDQTQGAASFLAAVAELPPASAGGREKARANIFSTPVKHRRLSRWFVVVPAAAVLAVSSVAVAARNARPGDLLFPVTRTLESARIHVAVGSVSRAVTTLSRAIGDFDKARSLAHSGRRHDAREALELFWKDLSAARTAIDALTIADATPLRARARTLAVAASALEDSLTGRDRGSEDMTDDRDPHSGSGSGSDDVREGSDSGSGEHSGESVTSGSSEVSGASGESSPSSTSGEDKSPSPAPTQTSDDGGSSSGHD